MASAASSPSQDLPPSVYLPHQEGGAWGACGEAAARAGWHFTAPLGLKRPPRIRQHRELNADVRLCGQRRHALAPDAHLLVDDGLGGPFEPQAAEVVEHDLGARVRSGERGGGHQLVRVALQVKGEPVLLEQRVPAIGEVGDCISEMSMESPCLSSAYPARKEGLERKSVSPTLGHEGSLLTMWRTPTTRPWNGEGLAAVACSRSCAAAVSAERST